MKLSYKTNAWQTLSWNEHTVLAEKMELDGLELCYSADELNDLLSDMQSRQQFLRRLSERQLEIACITADISGKYVMASHGVISTAKTTNDSERNQAQTGYPGTMVAEPFDPALNIASDCIELARLLRAPYVCLDMDFITDSDEARLVSLIGVLLPKAEAEGIILLIETKDAFSNTEKLNEILERFASDNLAALWNIHHTYIYGGESGDKTISNLGAYVKLVHVCDSFKSGDKTVRCLTGDGDVPLGEMLFALRSIDYKGHLTLDMTGDNSGLDDAEVVLPHYVNAIKQLTNKKARAEKYFDNIRKTGKYIWPKDDLLDITFSQMLDRVTEEFPDQYAFRYTTLDYTRTYSEFRDDVDCFARSLIALGVKPGDKVAVWATNVPQWFIAFWSAVRIGAVLVTMNTAYKIREAEYLLRQADVHTLVMIDGYRDSDYVGVIKKLCPELEYSSPKKPLHCKRLPFLRHIINVTSRQKGCLSWEDALEMGEGIPVEEVHRLAALTSPQDVCNMQYTSGTTGFPKGVMLTHHNIVNNGKCIGDRMDLSTADRYLIHVPMFHCFGMVLSMTASMTHGTTMSPLPYFTPKAALACVKQERITAINGVPTMFIAMLEHPDFNPDDFTHTRTGIMAGSPCPISVMRDVMDKMNMSEITIVFGQTESAPGCTMSSIDDPVEVRVGTVGRPLPGVECKVVDPETNKEMPDNENGEFVARGYNLMKGYYKMPEATAAAIDSEGWLHTGDLACRLPDGNFRITGRLRDMIIRGGENIYPKEIEEFLYTHPQIRDVQVIGVPSEQYGEEIMACIILKDDESMTESEVKEFVHANMAKHKVPSYVDFVTEFPMNAAGKIMKYKMREAAVEKLGLQKAAEIETA
ncbi:MAG: AMP-binding protein [Oscillospiraceae bacterium]|nr:AMP-binding protein [Oscillospiraceae bacterium]